MFQTLFGNVIYCHVVIVVQAFLSIGLSIYLSTSVGALI